MARLRKKEKGDISPDLTSFSDIANLLIIFFILTTSLVRPFGRQMDMPSSAKPPAQQNEKNDTPSVNVSKDKIMFTEGEKKDREVTLDQLRAELWKKNLPKRDPKQRVIVVETADDVPYERYYKVATAIAAAGGVIAVLTE